MRSHITRSLSVLVSFDPGLVRGDPKANVVQQITGVHVHGVETLAQLSPVMASEALRRLNALDDKS